MGGCGGPPVRMKRQRAFLPFFVCVCACGNQRVLERRSDMTLRKALNFGRDTRQHAGRRFNASSGAARHRLRAPCPIVALRDLSYLLSTAPCIPSTSSLSCLLVSPLCPFFLSIFLSLVHFLLCGPVGNRQSRRMATESNKGKEENEIATPAF